MAPKKKNDGDKKGIHSRGPKGMPKPVEPGLVLIDLRKRTWKLGVKIDQGGFGYLHLGSEQTKDGKKCKNELYVIKVEPHSNGPLFVELAFYQRAAKSEIIEEWKARYKLNHLGIPPYIGSGSFDFKGTKYRFLVMNRFSENVEEKFLSCGKSFSIETVLSLGIVIVRCLEFLHENEYVHADIKGSNLLQGYGTKEKGHIYLVDYGLAYRYIPGGRHVVYKEDPKRKHDGTIEYTSRDAHRGVAPSRRGDLEILGYCMLQWLAGTLPWEQKISNKETVFRAKEDFMKNVSTSLNSCLGRRRHLVTELEKYMVYVNSLKYEEKPDYVKINGIFSDGLKDRKVKFDGTNVKFAPGSSAISPRKRGLPNGNDDEDEDATPSKRPSIPKPSPLRRQRPQSGASSSAPTTRIVRRKPRNSATFVDKATSP